MSENDEIVNEYEKHIEKCQKSVVETAENKIVNLMVESMIEKVKPQIREYIKNKIDTRSFEDEARKNNENDNCNSNQSAKTKKRKDYSSKYTEAQNEAFVQGVTEFVKSHVPSNVADNTDENTIFNECRRIIGLGNKNMSQEKRHTRDNWLGQLAQKVNAATNEREKRTAGGIKEKIRNWKSKRITARANKHDEKNEDDHQDSDFNPPPKKRRKVTKDETLSRAQPHRKCKDKKPNYVTYDSDSVIE